MKTIVLTIGKLDSLKGRYPVKLVVAELDEQCAMPKKATATDYLPESLLPVSPVLDPVTNMPFVFEVVRDLYREEEATNARTQAMGEFLFALLIRGKVETEWRKHRGPHEAWRMYLDIQPAALRAAPWELLFDPRMSEYLFVDAQRTMLRGLPHLTAPTHDWPVRVMVVVGARQCAPDQADGLSTRKEERALRRVFARLRLDIEAEFCVRPSLTELQRAYDAMRPHILHFIGHGQGASAGSREAALLVHGETEADDWEWTVPRIKAALRQRSLVFAFLNACRSSKPVMRAGVAAVSDAMFDIGAVAVIGMQGDVADELAASFSEKFYEEIANGKPIDVAVASARRGVTLEEPRLASFDAAMPSLTCLGVPELVLPRRSASPPKEVEAFVDRREERRDFRERIDPIPASSGKAGNLLIVHGEGQVGKSGMVQWCLQQCYARDKDRLVRYVDLRQDVWGQGQKDYLNILRHIRDGEAQPLRAGLPREAFWRFNAELNALLAGEPLPASGDVVPTEDGGAPLPRDASTESFESHIFGSFRAAMLKAAGDRPLILALDHIGAGAVPEYFRKQICKNLLSPFAGDASGRVRIVVVASNQEMESHGLAELLDRQTIELLLFPEKHFSEFAMDYYWQNKRGGTAPDEDDEVQALIDAATFTLHNQPWKPERLEKIRKLVTN